MQDFGEILIVDDSSTSRIIIQRCVEMAGFAVGTVLFAENGLDAISLIKDNPRLDLIITDINMPKMDGQTLVRLVKSNPETAKIKLIVPTAQ